MTCSTPWGNNVGARAAQEAWDWLHERHYRVGGLLPQPLVAVHTHVCHDGTRVQCRSQWISTGVSLDRWLIGGDVVATSTRTEAHTIAPDFAWLDVAAA